MKKEVYYKYLFLISAVFNWIVGFSFLIADNKIRHLVGMNPSQDPFSWTMLLIFVIIFGIGYYWVSNDIYQNRNIAKLGIMGKISIVILSIIYSIRGLIPTTILLFVFPDLIFATLFIEFILNTTAAKKEN
jgi:hypothetical protein